MNLLLQRPSLKSPSPSLVTKNEEERRAFELLQWGGSPLLQNLMTASSGRLLLKIQRQRSDAALNAFDAAHPSRPALSWPLEPERLRIYSPHPKPLSKAKDGF